MSKEVKRRRGTQVEHDAFVGAEGEITVVTDDHTLRVHDGTTPGGHAAVGPEGPQGIPGNDGADGADGAQGIPGNDGVDGNDGAQGIPGNDGAQGIPGNDGAQGIPGNDGADGQGLPTGGTTGQVAKKQSNADFDIAWEDESGGTTAHNSTTERDADDAHPLTSIICLRHYIPNVIKCVVFLTDHIPKSYMRKQQKRLLYSQLREQLNLVFGH